MLCAFCMFKEDKMSGFMYTNTLSNFPLLKTRTSQMPFVFDLHVRVEYRFISV